MVFSKAQVVKLEENYRSRATILEGAACSEVEVRVNVTINGVQFVGSDSARIVRLSTLTTTASAYPAGSSPGAAAAGLDRLLGTPDSRKEPVR